MNGRLLVGTMACVAGIAGAAAGQVRVEYREVHMGLAVRMVLHAPDSAAAARAARAAYRRIAVLDDMMSDYRPESEVGRLSTAGPDGMPVSADLAGVLQEAKELARRSGGAFDPTAGPLVALWREARASGRLPGAARLDSARRLVDWEALDVDAAAGRARLTRPGMRLDLGGIAKGYILDQALVELRRHGIASALLEAGGDIVAGDAPPGTAGWRIDSPGAGPEVARRAAALANAAMATSGDGAQFLELGGVRYSHVVDPRTGRALTNRLRATVIAPDGMTADGLATALTVLGAEPGAVLLARYPGVVGEVGRDPASR